MLEDAVRVREQRRQVLGALLVEAVTLHVGVRHRGPLADRVVVVGGVRVEDGRAIAQRLLAVEDCGQLVVLDGDQANSFLGSLVGLGGHRRDALADEAHAL